MSPLSWKLWLNFIMDELGINRGKVKVTYFDENHRMQDLRCKVLKGQIILKDSKDLMDAVNNPMIVGGPIWDRGPRYVVFAGHDETINPLEWVKKTQEGILPLEKYGRSELVEIGAERERLLASKKRVDMQKIIAYLVLGVAALMLILVHFAQGELETLKMTFSTMLDLIREIHMAVGAGAASA